MSHPWLRSYARRWRVSCLLVAFLLSPLAAWAQTLPAIGQPGTFDVATWNIEWFGASPGPSNDDLQRANVARILRESEIDLWGVQEIADAEDFALLLGDLGADYAGVLATNSGTQRVGFVYRTDVVHVRSMGHILESFEYEFAFRPPLQLTADIVLGDTTVTATFIVVHMKANTGDASDRRESYERRADAARRLKNYIDFTALDQDAVVVLGDFNDELEQSIYGNNPTPFADFLADTDDYRFVTSPLDDGSLGTYCGSSSQCLTGSVIDHVLITDELFGAYVAGSARPYDDVLTEVAGYTATTSDHLPVVARFDFSRSATTAERPVAAAGSALGAVYPQPLRDRGSLPLRLAQPSAVTVTVFDAVGRQLTATPLTYLPAGTQVIDLDLTTAAAGLYVVRVTINGRAHHRPLLVHP